MTDQACPKCGGTSLVEKLWQLECLDCGWAGKAEEARRAAKQKRDEPLREIEREAAAQTPKFFRLYGGILYRLFQVVILASFVWGVTKVPAQIRKSGLGGVLLPVAAMIPGAFWAFLSRALSLGNRDAGVIMSGLGLALGIFLLATETTIPGIICLALFLPILIALIVYWRDFAVSKRPESKKPPA